MDPLRLPATLDSLERLGKYVIAATEEAGLGEKAAYGLRLAVTEIATNIITHGYEEAGRRGDVAVFRTLTDSALTVVLEDTGVPFDPRTRKLPAEEDLKLPLEQRPIGGLGIYLVLKNVDVFQYEYVDGKNRNLFTVNLAR